MIINNSKKDRKTVKQSRKCDREQTAFEKSFDGNYRLNPCLSILFQPQSICKFKSYM